MYQNWLLRTGGLGCRAAAVAILASSRMAAGEELEEFPGRRVSAVAAAATAAAPAAAMTIAGLRRRRWAGLPAGGLLAGRSSHGHPVPVHGRPPVPRQRARAS